MTYEQWCARATELQDEHGHTGKPKGQLSQVSIYEFVNDWLRPEVAWQIYSYVGGAEDEHKDAIQKRLRRAGKTKPKIYNENGHCDWVQRPLPSPNSGYNIISIAHDKRRNEEWDTRMKWLYQDNRASHRCLNGIKDGRVLIHYNPTITCLARFHRMTKKALADKLRELNVKGRTKIMKTYDVGGHHQPQIVTAIMTSPNYSTGYLDDTSYPSRWWLNNHEYKRRHIDYSAYRPFNTYNSEGQAWQSLPHAAGAWEVAAEWNGGRGP